MGRVRFVVLAVLVFGAIAGTAVGASNGVSPSSMAPGQNAPVETTPPSISGTLVQGETLTADPGTWAGPTQSYAFQWARCNSSGAACSPIAEAIAQAYTLVATDVGSMLRVVVTASNKNGSGVATSDPTGVVAVAVAPSTTSTTTPQTTTTTPTPTTTTLPTTTTTPAPGSPYWVGDFRNGDYCNYFAVFEANSVNTALASWGGLGGCEYTPWAQSTSQRVNLTHNPAPPAGSASTWVSRQEIRTTDSDWAGTGLDKSTIRLTNQQTCNGPCAMGTTRWFRFSFWLPNNNPTGEFFNWPGNDWETFFSIHTSSNLYEPITGTVRKSTGEYTGNPRVMMFTLEGATAGSAEEWVPFLNLTDAAGNRVTSSYNRWHTLILGVTFSDQGSIGSSPGHLTIIFDGETVYDKARPTARAGDTGEYLAFQNYKNHSAAYWNGAGSSTLYFADARIGYTRADVGG
jgi:hypothetical protein